jgi:hypothetical protein
MPKKGRLSGTGYTDQNANDVWQAFLRAEKKIAEQEMQIGTMAYVIKTLLQKLNGKTKARKTLARTKKEKSTYERATEQEDSNSFQPFHSFTRLFGVHKKTSKPSSRK